MPLNVIRAQEALLARLAMPALLLTGEQITFANKAALHLLGRHIIGANARLALRAPSAISAVFAMQDAQALVPGLGTVGSIWELSSQHLDNDRRLVTMQDKSEQRSIARVHADFVANASHELRTPLASIIGYAESLNDPQMEVDIKIREKFMGTILREARRMQALVSDLMSLSRIEAEKHRMPSEQLDLREICYVIESEFAGEHDILFTLPNTAMAVLGDRPQLEQALRNLVDNAIKYGAETGAVEVRLEAQEGGWAKLEVRDNGSGIAADHIPRLTERFYRTDPARSKAVGGTGLGLSIVKHIVIKHRGRMDIESRLGEGTTIKLRFPLIKI